HHAGEFSARHAIEIGGQPWVLVVTAPAQAFRSDHFGPYAYALMVSALLLTGLFAASLLVLSGNSRRIQEIVRDRTRRLDLSARVFDSTAEGIIITDAQRGIISVNPSFTAITGYAAAEVLGADPRSFGAGEQDSGYFGAPWETLTEHGRWQGEVWNRRKTGETFPAWMTISTARDGDGQILNYIATFTDISQQKQAAEHIHHLAYFDALTGLANRSLLELRGEQAITAAEPAHRLLAVLFLDVDRFKTINDSLGHLAGDQLLQTVAERLRCSVRDEDTVARLGGDEFLVLMADLNRREDAALLARKILAALAVPTRIESQDIAVTASIGISLYPYDGQDFPTLVKNADVALYKAKEAGRNRVQFFEAAMSAHSFERLVLENALRGALDRGELMLYFQPQINIATGLVVGAEALLRWRHPDLGIIGPKRFIRLAEEGGMIAAIGEWAIRTVCRTLARWEQEGVPCTTIAVNISALQFKQDLADLVREALTESGIAPRLLELELTESLLM
ncbi:MAG: diguanylate cyclase, partial [Gammaproteobacteria bacterium]|nr:diguanylate cyclase [Gammaproteobacteria bacterium]